MLSMWIEKRKRVVGSALHLDERLKYMLDNKLDSNICQYSEGAS